MTSPTLTPASSAGPAQAAVIALLLVAVPLFAGIIAGRALSRWRWSVVVATFAVMALTLIATVELQQVGVWDTISIGVLLIVGLLLGCARIDRRGAFELAISSAFAIAVREAAVRWWLPHPRSFPSPDQAALVFEPAAWDAGCSVLYAANVDEDVHVLRPVTSGAKERQHPPLVVHLGDSMTYGEGVKADETFAALLDARQRTVQHRNYGVWAVGTDFEFLLLQRILDLHSPALVVLHVYVGNDVYDIDRPYACCEAGPLLDYGPDGPIVRCEHAQWSLPVAFRLSRSPAPYPLRVATRWSYAARHIAAAFPQLMVGFEPRSDFVRSEGEAGDTGWDHFEQILAKLHDNMPPNADLVVDLLPVRSALEAADPTASPAYRAGRRIAKITEELGIRTLDSWDLFAKAVARDGSLRYFRDEHDIHFTPEGHRLLADWLEKELPTQGGS